MQDLSDGSLRPLASKFFEGIPTLPSGLPKDCRETRDAIQRACDEAQPDRAKQGPVFMLGEIIEIRGGRFQVTRIEPGHLRLKSLPKEESKS